MKQTSGCSIIRIQWSQALVLDAMCRILNFGSDFRCVLILSKLNKNPFCGLIGQDLLYFTIIYLLNLSIVENKNCKFQYFWLSATCHLCSLAVLSYRHYMATQYTVNIQRKPTNNRLLIRSLYTVYSNRTPRNFRRKTGSILHNCLENRILL